MDVREGCRAWWSRSVRATPCRGRGEDCRRRELCRDRLRRGIPRSTRIITERDLLFAVGAHGRTPTPEKVVDHMSESVITAAPDGASSVAEELEAQHRD